MTLLIPQGKTFQYQGGYSRRMRMSGPGKTIIPRNDTSALIATNQPCSPEELCLLPAANDPESPAEFTSWITEVGI